MEDTSYKSSVGASSSSRSSEWWFRRNQYKTSEPSLIPLCLSSSLSVSSFPNIGPPTANNRMDSRGTKRTSNSLPTDTNKRRAPYAARACTACRRRKGKCNGQQPCDYCENRGQTCVYDGEGVPPATATRGQAQPSAFQSDKSDQRLSQPRTPALANGPPSPASLPTNPGRLIAPSTGCESNHDSDLTGLVASLHAQLRRVEAVVEAQSNGTNSLASGSIASAQPLHAPGDPTNTSNRQLHATQTDTTPNPASHCFYGPTSPDYSMNLVQITLRQLGYITSLSHHPLLPSVDGNDALSSSVPHWQPRRHCDRHQLMQFRSWLSLQEVEDAVDTYHKVIGELHPFVDIDRIRSQLESYYSSDVNQSLGGENNQADDNDLIILVLMLAIVAQASKDTLLAKMASVLYSNFMHSANAAVTSPTTSIKQVTIALLLVNNPVTQSLITAYYRLTYLIKGCYYSFHDLSRLALRLCGAAGRMLMDLGFHNSDILNHILKTDGQRKEASAMMCSVIILDRQWSAMTGLPANFPNATFSPMPACLVSALISFLHLHIRGYRRQIVGLSANPDAHRIICHIRKQCTCSSLSATGSTSLYPSRPRGIPV